MCLGREWVRSVPITQSPSRSRCGDFPSHAGPSRGRPPPDMRTRSRVGLREEVGVSGGLKGSPRSGLRMDASDGD
jgi:hypothetical protein